MNRTARVEAGITNLGITAAVQPHGFFYAPDPSSQLACTLAGNIAMNSGGAHCLKYGVTTNNVLGVKMVLMDGSVVEIGGAASRRAGLRPAGAAWSARRASSASSPRRRCASCARPEAARPMLLGFDFERGGRAMRVRHHRVRHHSGRHRVHGQAGDRGVRGLRQGRLSAQRRGAADRRGRRLGRGDLRPAGPHRRDRPAAQSEGDAHQRERGAERRHLEGPQVGVRRHRPDLRLLLHGRHHPARPAAGGAGRRSATSASSTA